jgi:hypothetical protein
MNIDPLFYLILYHKDQQSQWYDNNGGMLENWTTNMKSIWVADEVIDGKKNVSFPCDEIGKWSGQIRETSRDNFADSFVESSFCPMDKVRKMTGQFRSQDFQFADQKFDELNEKKCWSVDLNHHLPLRKRRSFHWMTTVVPKSVQIIETIMFRFTWMNESRKMMNSALVCGAHWSSIISKNISFPCDKVGEWSEQIRKTDRDNLTDSFVKWRFCVFDNPRKFMREFQSHNFEGIDQTFENFNEKKLR